MTAGLEMTRAAQSTIRPDLQTATMSVVIASRSRPVECEAAWRSVARELPDAQLIVVEQVIDGAEYPIADDFPGMWLRQRGTGLSRGRNLGLKHVDRECVLFLDDDAVLVPDIRRLLERHSSRDADVTCGVIHFHGAELDPYDARESIVPSRVGVLFIESSAIWNPSDLRDVGGFDERFGVGAAFGAEEGPQLLSRLIGIGKNRIVHEPIVAFTHPPVDGASPSKVYSYGRGMGALLVLSPSWWLVRYISFTVSRAVAGVFVFALRGSFREARRRVSRLRGVVAGASGAIAVRFFHRRPELPVGGSFERVA